MKLLDESNIDTELNDGTWLLTFWASWCGPCLDTEHLEEFESKTPGVVVGRINMEENPGLAAKYGVIVVPTYILMNYGKQVKKMIGIQTVESLQESLLALKS